ncbi:MAG TPA: MFS transporter [Anaerolineaceae bacterium]
MEPSSGIAPLPSTGRIAKTAGYYAGFLALGMTAASLGPTLPGLAAHTHANIGEISFLFTARALGYLLGSLRGGRLYDRLSGHLIQTIALLGMAAMMGLVPVLPILWVLAAALTLLGFFEGTLDVGANTMIVWVHGEKVGPFMSALHFFFGVGAFLSPILIGQVILQSGDINWAYWLIGLLLLPVAAVMSRLSSPPIPAHADPQNAGKVSTLLLGLFMVFFCLIVGVESSYGGWVYTYSRAVNLATDVTAAYLTSAFWGALTLGRLLAIPIATRVHPRWILLACLLGCTASVAAVLLFPGSFATLAAGSFGTGLFLSSLFPSAITLAGRHLPVSGRITGFFFVGASAGSMFFPWLIGQLFGPVGPSAVMLVILALLGFALADLAGLTTRLRMPQLAEDTE